MVSPDGAESDVEDSKYIIGLTGNIATGKTRVRELLESLGAATIDADELAHQLMAPGTRLWQRVVEAFGQGILTPEGAINRAELARIVFSNAAELNRLEQMVHPAVVAEAFRRAQKALGKVVVIEAIKLVEAGMDAYCDELWLVTCRPEQQIDRLRKGRGWARDQAERRMRAQTGIEEKLSLADVVIDNSGEFIQTEGKVREQWERVKKKVAGGRR